VKKRFAVHTVYYFCGSGHAFRDSYSAFVGQNPFQQTPGRNFFPPSMKAVAVGFYRQLGGLEGDLPCFLFRNVRELESVSGVTSKALAN